MTRTLGLTMLLVSLLIVGVLFVQQTQTSSPSAPAVTQDDATRPALCRDELPGHGNALQACYAGSGTCTGATLPPGSGVVLVHADATSYCLQTLGSATATVHETGPNGTPQPGAC